MKKKLTLLTSLLLAACIMLSLAACGKEKAPSSSASAEEVFYALLNNVQYSSALTDSSDSADLMYADLPEGAVVTMYAGDAQYADELTWIVLAQKGDFDDAMEIVQIHIDEKHDQFLSYHPDEVPKVDGALIWSDSTNIILCITGDYDNAEALAKNPPPVSTPAPTPEPVAMPDSLSAASAKI